MKNLIKSVLVAFGAMALVSACEAAGGSETTSTGNDTGGGGGGGVDNGPVIGAEEFPAIEIQDDKDNSTLTSCDEGTLKSPGADIDAAQVGAGGYLTSCTVKDTVGCESTASSVSDAEGAPDSGGKEASGEYLSLNGGTLRCNWSDGTILSPTSGETITVYEVGGTGGTNVEQYRVRVCKSTGGNCSSDSNYSSGEAQFPTSALF